MTVSSTANSPTPSLRAFLLAGGRSSRMGQDKALLSIHGQPLVQQMLAKLRALGLEATVCGNRADLAAYSPILPDAAEACGPLGGITAALESSPPSSTSSSPSISPACPSHSSAGSPLAPHSARPTPPFRMPWAARSRFALFITAIWPQACANLSFPAITAS